MTIKKGIDGRYFLVTKNPFSTVKEKSKQRKQLQNCNTY